MNSYANPTGFSFTPLDGTPAQVRLLHLSQKGSSITGTVRHISLNSTPTSHAPKFNTLSYVWGKQKKRTKSITLKGPSKKNSGSFSVLDTLYPALELICSTPELASAWWWIDSICINQSDDDEACQEREEQVQMMGRIYSESNKTIGWLGEARDGAMAMDFLDFLLANRERIKEEHSNCTVRHMEEKGIRELNKYSKEWIAVTELLKQPWWTRVWTLQEYLLPRKFTLYYGSKSMTRETFNKAIYLVWILRKFDPSVIPKKAFLPAWNRRRIKQWHSERKKQLPLVALMAYGSDSNATNPKDRIYSLLGLARDAELGKPIRYCKSYSAATAFSQLVKSFVKANKNLDIICFVHVFNRQNAKSALEKPGTPSWAPDWSVSAQSYVVPAMASQSAGDHIGNFRPYAKINPDRVSLLYDAAGGTEPICVFSKDLLTLTCTGILVDCVDGRGGMSGKSEENCHDSKSSINRNTSSKRENSNILEALAHCLVLGSKDKYLTYPTPPGHFYAIIHLLSLKALKAGNDAQDEFGDWFQLNKTIHIQGQSLEDVCKTAKKPSQTGELITRFQHKTQGMVRRLMTTNVKHQKPAKKLTEKKDEHKKFLDRFRHTTQDMERRLITTDKGYLGMAPIRAQRGDEICVLYGCSIPLILRPYEKSYVVIGECYLYGFMNGEALEMLNDGKLDEKKFQLV